ncbi:hypothetical protein [Saccharopolyspora pogona]|uniref:hypothetical protein n=1 Tax=Saccharopolyspora pogona TaxID=333966 RepID=UPI001687A158|nr:hypothetical protein [Saccharopolyspora pogona]
MIGMHPEIPPDGERDHSLLISEAQQQHMLVTIVEIEHDIRRELLLIVGDTPTHRAAVEADLAEICQLAAQACRAVRNAVTVEERIAHLDFEIDDQHER